MKVTSWSVLLGAALSTLAACSAGAPSRTANPSLVAKASPSPDTVSRTDSQTQNSTRIVHVLVALCDNEHQGIVPVPARLGNGEDPERNLYWMDRKRKR